MKKVLFLFSLLCVAFIAHAQPTFIATARACNQFGLCSVESAPLDMTVEILAGVPFLLGSDALDLQATSVVVTIDGVEQTCPPDNCIIDGAVGLSVDPTIPSAPTGLVISFP